MKSSALLRSVSLLVLVGSVVCLTEDTKDTKVRRKPLNIIEAGSPPASPDARQFGFGGLGGLGFGGFGLGGLGFGGLGLGGLGFGGLGGLGGLYGYGLGYGGLGYGGYGGFYGGGLGLGGLGFGGLGFGGLGFGLFDEDADSDEDSADRVPTMGMNKTAMNDEDTSDWMGKDGSDHQRHGGMQMGWGNKHHGWGKHSGWGMKKHHGWGHKSGMKHHASWDSRRRSGMEHDRRGQEEMVDVVLKPIEDTKKDKDVKQDEV